MFLTPRHLSFFFFNDTATTEIYTLSLHDALPISLNLGLRYEYNTPDVEKQNRLAQLNIQTMRYEIAGESGASRARSEEHTSELQSRPHLVCRLLLEKKRTRVS